MRVALIPPIPDLHKLPRTGIHLLLSQHFRSKVYIEYYQERRNCGDHLILDNGAHENGIGEEASRLIAKASVVNAQEIVVPDALFDRRATVERTKRFLRHISGRGKEEYIQAGSPRLMLVPQAPERAEWDMCLRAQLAAWDKFLDGNMESPVIGISKDYDNWRGGLVRLLSDFIEPLYDERDFDIHLLGWSNNLWTTAKIAKEYPWVRSTDSAKPFVFAKKNIRLEPGGPIPRYPRRDPDYFLDSLPINQWEIAMFNVEVYRAAAQNRLV